MVYSFDVFDTLITRATAEPKGIFTVMEDRLQKDIRYRGIPIHIRRHFRDFRVEAEAQARYRARGAGREDVTLNMIYTQLVHMNYMSGEQEKMLLELELATELEFSIPIDENIRLLKELKKKNDIYLLSDMYLPAEHIRRMLIAADEVFVDIPILVSGELGRTKGSGSLYSYFVEKYQVNWKEWIHIGDNFSSDYLVAEQVGARSKMYRQYSFSVFEKELLERFGGEYATQMVLGTVKNVNKKTSSAAYRIGASIGGPILYGYVLWVLQEARRQGIQTLFFMARDGYVLQKIADIIIRQQKWDIHTRYLYGSRYAWRISAVSADKEIYNAWLKCYASFSSYIDLAEELHMMPEELKDFFPGVLRKEGKRFSVKEKELVKEILRSDEALFRKINKHHEEKRRKAAAYLRQEMDSAIGKVAFVEVNGSGGTQYCMHLLMQDFYKEPIVTFYHTMNWYVDFPMEGNFFYKYVYEKLQIEDIVEIFTRAPHGQTRGYCQDEKGRWKPVLDESGVECPEFGSYIEYINGSLAFTREMCIRCQCSGEDLAELSQIYIRHICTEPEKDVQDFIGDMPFSLEGTREGSGVYAPKLTDAQLEQLFLFGIPEQECYSGLKLAFSLLRLNQEQRKLLECYKALNPGHQIKRQYKNFCDYSYEVSGNVVLYGAGKRGENIFAELQKNTNAKVVLWVDRNYKNCFQTGMDINDPEKILEISYDYVIIGVKDEGTIQEIRRDLVEMGVPISKILW